MTNTAKVVDAPFAHTHSSIEQFETCPRKYHGQYVSKEVKFTPSEHTDLGNVVHKLAEWYVQHRIGKAPTCGDAITEPGLNMGTYLYAKSDTNARACPEHAVVLQHWNTLRAAIDKLPVHPNLTVLVEAQLGMSRDFVGCDYFDKDAAFRGKLDLTIVHDTMAVIADYKSSKDLKTSKQMARSAILVFINFPSVQTVSTILLSSRGHDPIVETFSRVHLMDLYNSFVKEPTSRIREAYASDKWPQVKSGLCKDFCGVFSCPKNGKAK